MHLTGILRNVKNVWNNMDPKKMDTETGEMIVKRVSVPVGLEELMEGLAKEVLLKKPEDLYLFAAKYFSQLLLLREKTSYKVKAVRSAQSVIEPSRKWSSRNYAPRATTKELSRQMSIRGDSPRKDSISKIPQKDKLPFKKDKDKIAEAPEPFALEGKKYISNRSNIRNSRNVSIERPKNIHHRERSLNSTEKSNLAQPLSKQRKSLPRDSKIKQDKQVDENNKQTGGASDSFRNPHKSAKAEQSIKTIDKIDTELPKKPVGEHLLAKASFDRVQDIDIIKPEKNQNQHENETTQESSANIEVIKNQVKEIIPKQKVDKTTEKSNFEDSLATEKESNKTPTNDLEIKVDEQTNDGGVKGIIRDDNNKTDNEKRTENSLELVTNTVKVCKEIKEGEDHKADHEAHIVSKDVRPLELVTDIQKIDNEIKDEKVHKTVHTENTENDRNISKMSADINPLDLVPELITVEDKIKNENGHNKEDDNKMETESIETPIVTSEKQTSKVHEVVTDNSKDLEAKTEILPLKQAENEHETEYFNTISTSPGETDHLKFSKTVLDNEIREISNRDETKNKKVVEEGSNEVHAVRQILASKIDDQEINSNISNSIPSGYNNVSIENDEPKNQKNINTIQNQEINEEQQSSTLEKTDIINCDQGERSKNSQQTYSNNLINELNNNVITTDERDKMDKEVVEEHQSDNNTENVKILEDDDSNFDSKVTTQNQSSIDKKIIENEEITINNKDIFGKCEEPKRGEEENLTDEVNTHHRVARSLNKIDEESSFDAKKINDEIQTDKEKLAQVAERENKPVKIIEESKDNRTNKGHIDEKNGKTPANFLRKNNGIDKEIIGEKPDNSLEKKLELYEKKGNQSESEYFDIIEAKNDTNKVIVDKDVLNEDEHVESHNDIEKKVAGGILSNTPESIERKETNYNEENKIETKDEAKDAEIIDNNKGSIAEEGTALLDKNASTDKENHKESKNLDENTEIYSNDNKKDVTDEKIHSFDNSDILDEKDAKMQTEQKDNQVENSDNTERHINRIKKEVIDEKILALEGSKSTEKEKLATLNKGESVEKQKESMLQREEDENEDKNQSINNKAKFDDSKKEVISENISKKDAVTLQSENEKNKDKNKPEFDNEKKNTEVINETATALNKSEGSEKKKAETLSFGIESIEQAGTLQNGTENIDDIKKDSNGDSTEMDVNEKFASLENVESIANEEANITQSEKENIEDDKYKSDTKKESDKDDIEKSVIGKKVASFEKTESIVKAGADTSLNGKEKIENEDKNLVTKNGSNNDNIEKDIIDKNVASSDKSESIEKVEVDTSQTEKEQIENEDKNLDTKKESDKDNTVNDENVASLEKSESIEKVKADTSQRAKEKIEDDENYLDTQDDSDKDNIEKNVIDEKVALVEKSKYIEKTEADISQSGKEKIENEEKTLDIKKESNKDNIERDITNEEVASLENSERIEKIKADTSQSGKEKIGDDENNLDTKDDSDKDNIRELVIDEKVASLEKNENIENIEGDTSQSEKKKIENNEKDIDNIQNKIDEKVTSLRKTESTAKVEAVTSQNEQEKMKDNERNLDTEKESEEHNNKKVASGEKGVSLENNEHKEIEKVASDEKEISLENNEHKETETLQGEKEKSENREKEETETSHSEKEMVEDHNNILDIMKVSDKDYNEKTVTDEKVPPLEISESTDKIQASTLSSENKNKNLDDKVKHVNDNLDKKELKNDQNLKKEESIDKGIAVSEKEKDVSNNIESNKEIDNNINKNKVSETKIASTNQSENMERKGGNESFDEKNQQIKDVAENEKAIHQGNVINEDKSKHTEISTNNKKEGIYDTDTMFSKVESVDKNKVDVLDRENNKDKESKSTNLAKNAEISNVEDTEQMFKKQVRPLLEANLSVEENDVQNKKLDTTENHSDNNNNKETLVDNNKSIEQQAIDSKNNNLLLSELQKNDKDLGANNKLENLNKTGDIVMDDNQNTTKIMSVPETAKSYLEIEKSPTKLVNETDEDREIAKKILGEAHENSNNINDIKINREDIDTNKQIQISKDQDGGKNGLKDNEQKPRQEQEDIDDKEAIDATIAAIKAGVISKVVKDYINNFIDNEKVISSKPNQEASETDNINKSEKNEKRTMSIEENENEINAPKTDSFTPEKPVESQIDSKNIYNITANYDKGKYRDRLLNKTLAVLKIQSLWRGFIVRKNLNIFNTYFDNDHEHDHEQMQIHRNVEKRNKINYDSQDTAQKTHQGTDAKGNNEENNKISLTPNLSVNIKDEAKSDNEHAEEGNMDNEEVSESERKVIDHLRDDNSKTIESEASEEDKSDGEQQDRPKTTDSVVTVISKKDKDNKAEELADLLIDPEAESEGEHLIAAQQSQLLDQISGKNDAHLHNKDYMRPLSSQEESETEREFCKVQPPNKIIKTMSLPDDVELVSKDNENAETNSEHASAVQLDRVVSAQEHTPSSTLLHTGELHDTVMVPLSSETHDVVKNQDKNTIMQEASESTKLSLPDYTPKGLLHTSELHDSVIIPTEVWNRHGYEENEITGPNIANGAIIKDHVAVESQDKNNSMQEVLKSPKPSSPDYTSKGLLHTSELHDGVIVPTEAWNTDSYEENKVTGLKLLEPDTTNDANITASSAQSPPTSTVDVDSIDKARAPSRSDSAPSGPGRQSSELRGMEKQNAEVHEFTDKNMEAAAATKIQAGFRGYQVRKELKHKAEHSDAANQRTSNKIKSTGRNSGNRKDLEEKSAVKIQAGVRGFLVRKKQKKQKNPDTKQP